MLKKYFYWIRCHWFNYHVFTTAFLERGGKLNPKITEQALTEEELLTSDDVLQIMLEDNSVYCKHCKKRFTYAGSTFRNYKK